MKPFVLAISLTLLATAASAQSSLYSAKLICGKTTNAEASTFLAAPGSYFTAINVHNPSTANAGIRKRFTLGKAGEQVGAISNFVSMTLPPARTMLIECRNIWGHLGIPAGTFIEGFVEIRANVELDVVGVYTTAPANGGVSSIMMERVPRRAQ
jgi:hypothetical protein